MTGMLSAFNGSNGLQLWQYFTPCALTSSPSVGWLSGGAGYCVVQAVGGMFDDPAEIHAIAASTGKIQWIFQVPDNSFSWLHWSAPIIDAAGTVYIVKQNGPIYTLRDSNGDGRVEGDGEVSIYFRNQTYCGSQGPSMGPGMFVVATCDATYVFQY